MLKTKAIDQNGEYEVKVGTHAIHSKIQEPYEKIVNV